MIITEQKEFDEILHSLEGHERVFLVGCGICATTWGTGGEKETREMAAQLVEAGKECTGWIVTEEATCDVRTTRRLLKRNKDCLLYTSPSPRDRTRSRMPSSA